MEVWRCGSGLVFHTSTLPYFHTDFNGTKPNSNYIRDHRDPGANPIYHPQGDAVYLPGRNHCRDRVSVCLRLGAADGAANAGAPAEEAQRAAEGHLHPQSDGDVAVRSKSEGGAVDRDDL